MSEGTLLEQAIEALRQGQKSQAREILTRLIQAEPDNALYWVWLSAAVESEKERRYCLERAFEIDPQNIAAQHGLFLFGARPVTQDVPPFPIPRPSLWERRLQASEKAEKRAERRPLRRIFLWGALVVLLIALSAGGFLLARPNRVAMAPTATPGPSPTFTFTPTFINATGIPPTPTPAGPPPLWTLLEATYTPTPLYVSTPRQPQSLDVQRSAAAAYARQDWESFIVAMQQIAQLEPQAADPFYYIGEAYRFQGKYAEAARAYQRALEINPRFAPGYLGQARVTPALDPKADIEPLLNKAIEYDPNFGEAYLERARLYFARGKYELALQDLKRAEALLPGSPLVSLLRAQIYWQQGEKKLAQDAAEEANRRDLTLLPVYALLGEIYADQGTYDRALTALDRYLTYQPNDVPALLLMGKTQYQAGEYASSVKTLSMVIERAPRQGEAYLYRGLAYLEMGNAEKAVNDLDRALVYFPQSYEAHLGMARAFFAQEKYGNTYQESERAYGLAKSDEQKAQAIYWRALSLEKLGDIRTAIRDWNLLLTTYRKVLSEEQLREAQSHLEMLRTPTLTPTVTRTPTRTPTPTPSRTPKP
jgi:tetratricopeptide (TPR) repeat protein